MNRAQDHIEFLDYLRAIAIIAVFLFHLVLPVCGINILPWGNWFPQFTAPPSFWPLLPFSFGWCGVAIFFVVSGFCIHLSFKRKPDWLDFAARRFFRIYPAYFVALLFCALVLPWTRISFSRAGMVQLASHLGLVHNLGPETYHGINVAFWSIAVEVQLYLLYPLVLFLVRRLGWTRALACIGALEIGLRCVASKYLMSTGEIPLIFLGLPFTYWFSWSIGAYLADAYLSSKPLPFAGQSPLLWGGIAIASMFFKPLYAFAFLFYSLATASVIARCLSGSAQIKLPASFANHLRKAGLYSYSIYLLHAPFMYGACAPVLSLKIAAKLHLYDALPHPLIIFVGELAVWPFIMVLSGLSYRFLELPGIAMGKRFIKAINGNSKKIAEESSGRGIVIP